MTSQEWKKEIELYKESGMKIAEWCNSRNIKVGTFKMQLYRQKEKESQAQATQFVEVQPSKVSILKIELAGGASIVIDESTDLNMVSKLLRVL